jgi:hypothetical protein
MHISYNRRLKQDHNVVKSILEKSGFGWDPDKGVHLVALEHQKLILPIRR